MIPLQSRHKQIKAQKDHQNSEDKILTKTKDTDNRFLFIIIKRITNVHWIINLQKSTHCITPGMISNFSKDIGLTLTH